MKKFPAPLISSCVSQNLNEGTGNTLLNFNEDLNFDEFNKLLTKYAKINQYPKITE